MTIGGKKALEDIYIFEGLYFNSQSGLNVINTSFINYFRFFLHHSIFPFHYRHSRLCEAVLVLITFT